MSGYEEIISLPNHVPERHARMPMLDRAAQFLPFAALAGYDSAIEEAARLTCDRIELDESQKEILDSKLREAVEQELPIRITFFRKDEKKIGGFYVETEGRIRKIDPLEGTVLMQNREKIPIEDIVGIA